LIEKMCKMVHKTVQETTEHFETVFLCCTEGSRIWRNWTAFRLYLIKELLAAHRMAVEYPHPARPSEPPPPLDRLIVRHFIKRIALLERGWSPQRVCSLLQSNWEKKSPFGDKSL
jgi:hypothetical protein